MISPVPLSRDVVLVGGGHTHALILRHWAMNRLHGARITLIDPNPKAPYTGMLPGFVAGHYALDEIQIDLFRLCRCAGARLLLSAATDIDTGAKRVFLADGRQIAYDILSLDIGVHGSPASLPGFKRFGIAAKPLAGFAKKWLEFLANPSCRDIVVLGGGVAGAELALSMLHRLDQEGREGSVTIVETNTVLAASPPSLRTRLRDALDRAGIRAIEHSKVQRLDEESVHLSNGSTLRFDLALAAAGARPWPWLSQTNLPLERGYVKVADDLSVPGFDGIFAAGDCAHLTATPRPKAGVFAVRAAPVLRHNIEADLNGTIRKPFKPQRDFLKLVGLGSKTALANRGVWTFEGPRMWALKERIDRRFIDRLNNVPTMVAPPAPTGIIRASKGLMDPQCTGCGGKIPQQVLENALGATLASTDPDVVIPAGDDAALVRMSDATYVFSTDHIRAFDSDPWRVSRIAALHALGDIFAMGAAPRAALSQITLPPLSGELQERWLGEITQSAMAVFGEAGATLAGGHTATGTELMIGFSIIGRLSERAITLGGAMPGDRVVLTRPIGSGTLLRAEMEGRADGEHIANLFDILQSPQFAIAASLRSANAMTDVTGFGLIGHASKMATASEVHIELDRSAIPFFPGALDLAKKGLKSSLYPANRAACPEIKGDDPETLLLFDPQTAGGFLAALPQSVEIPPGAYEIGRVTAGEAKVTLH